MTIVLLDDGRDDRRANDTNAWWRYASEILAHAGIRHVHQSWSHDSPAPGVAVVTHSVQAADQLTTLQEWVARGGAVVSVGDPGELASLVGAERHADVDHGHVEFGQSEMWTDKPEVALRAFGGVRLQPMVDDVITVAHWGDGAPAMTVRPFGRGVAVALGVDIWQTVVRIQQGYPVIADGTPAEDGTAPIDDGILKCEDGLALSFVADRAMPPGQPDVSNPFRHVWPPEGPAPLFHRPHADMWRSVLLQCVWWAAARVGVPQAWLYYWPAGVPAVAHMSHDSDLNNDEDARVALETFAEASVPVTWCHAFPGGYEPDTYAAIASAGHEHALHYNAIGDADIALWGWRFMRAQHAWAQAVTGKEKIVSNKNHYTRWEGWTEFYQWCERLGIEIDESRGPSKQGTVGFPFGTVHVSFPMADAAQDNRLLDVLSLPLHTQDLALASHESVRDVILDAALTQHGVAHFLFHGVHLQRPDTRKACIDLAAAARDRGMVWWTAEQINRWERDRRGVAVSVQETAAGWMIVVQSPRVVSEAALLLQLPGVTVLPRLTDGTAAIAFVNRHGREFVELSANLPPGRSVWQLAR